MFGPAWFARHQRTLLWLLNAPLLGRWFRWVLCIRPCDVGYRRVITRLYPHAYEVENDDGTITADFRTHEKYGKRLYYGLLPLWRVLHWWDEMVANPWVPALNAGFDTLTVYPEPDPATKAGDAQINRQFVNESWTSLRTGAGNAVDNATTAPNYVRIGSEATANQWSYLSRVIIAFDTSAIAAGTVTAATVSLKFYAKNDPLGIAPDIDIYGSTPANPAAMVASDFGNCGTTSYTGAATSYASLTTGSYTVFTFNATGVSAIQTAGVSCVSVRNSNYDVAAAAPAWSASLTSEISGLGADQTGTAEDPKLTVTYARPGSFQRNKLRPRLFAPGRAR